MNSTEIPHAEGKENTKMTFDNLGKILSIFPIFLCIGILYQFSSLVGINKLTFFSWSQVINDSVALFFPILFGMGGYVIANFLDPHIKGHGKFLGQLFLSLIGLGVIYMVLLGLRVPYILYQSYLIGVFASILPTSFTYVRIHTGSEKSKDKNYIIFSRIIVGVVLFFALMSLSKDREYKNLNLIVNGNSKEVIYMNDVYVFTKDIIYHNDASMHFSYSGMIQ